MVYQSAQPVLQGANGVRHPPQSTLTLQGWGLIKHKIPFESIPESVCAIWHLDLISNSCEYLCQMDYRSAQPVLQSANGVQHPSTNHPFPSGLGPYQHKIP